MADERNLAYLEPIAVMLREQGYESDARDVEAAVKKIKRLAARVAELEGENDDLHENLIRVMRQRNAQTFALQCFHSHAVNGGETETAERLAEYLTAAGHPVKPQHWLIDTSAALAASTGRDEPTVAQLTDEQTMAEDDHTASLIPLTPNVPDRWITWPERFDPNDPVMRGG
ncbi:MAG: hypothetical protein V3U14_12995 [candidate division NC10 bacterium]